MSRYAPPRCFAYFWKKKNKHEKQDQIPFENISKLFSIEFFCFSFTILCSIWILISLEFDISAYFPAKPFFPSWIFTSDIYDEREETQEGMWMVAIREKWYMSEAMQWYDVYGIKYVYARIVSRVWTHSFMVSIIFT